MDQPVNYLIPDVPGTLPWHKVKTVIATDETLKGYGCLVSREDYEQFPIEIVRWPKPEGRSVDAGTGDEAGVKEGIFDFWWEGEVLFGRNNAVKDEYLLGWSVNPDQADRNKNTEQLPERVLLWHANYHPDGGQLFFPVDGSPFVTPLALPGDDVTLDKFVNFYFDGTQGLYIHPNIWHEGIFPLARRANCFDRQGANHARVSVNFAREFGVFLEVALGL
jgi:ureidoglycolate lyase